MEKIVFLDRNAVRRPMRTANFPHEWIEYTHTPPELTVERLQGATVAITNRVAITAEVLDTVPPLRMVAVAATGFDHVDVAACTARGITVSNLRNYSVSVPEHVFALTLALRRQFPAYQKAVADGRWQQSATYGVIIEPIPHTLAGGTMGIIGYGALARTVETLARAFGMNVLVAERKGAESVREGRTPFEDVLAQSDVLVLLCPLTNETRNLIGASELAQMRADSLLINCARGGIVDEQALAQALRDGTIAGAGVDVLSEEPPRSGNVLLDPTLPNLIVTPHTAWASIESLEAIAEQIIANIEAFVAGTPRNLITA